MTFRIFSVYILPICKVKWSQWVRQKPFSILINKVSSALKGVLHLLPKIIMFCLNLKLSKDFWKMIYASYSKLFKELKNGIEILVGQAVLKLWIKQ